MANFLKLPTRGGKLTILNCLLWTIVAIGVAAGIPLLTLPALVACWPLACGVFLPSIGHPSKSSVVFSCIVIGANSLLWGYGISWIWSLIARRRRPQRGFEVLPATPRSP
jgi:hypothetical protein